MPMAMTMAVVPPSPSFRTNHRHHHHHQLFLRKPKNPNLKTTSPSFFPPKSSLSTSTQPLPTITSQNLSLSQSIQSLCENGNLNEAFELLQQNPTTTLREKADSITALLHACGPKKDLELGRKIHQMVSNSNSLSNDIFISTRLVTMYSMCESPLDACLVFNQLENRNLYLWNALISGFNRTERWFEAMLVFYELLWDSEFRPDNYTMPCVIKACGSLKSLEMGRVVHGMGLKIGLCSDTFVCHSLIAMYGKCGCVDEAVQVFENMPERNIVSWNSMIFAFSESGFVDDSLDVFREILMGDDGLIPDVATLVTVLPVCADERDVKMGKMVHALVVKLDLMQELKVSNALIDMYMKCGCVSDAETLFSKNDQKNVVSWNAMIGGYSGKGDVSMTFDLLRQMQMAEGEIMKPNAITILNVLPACLELSELRKLKELHGYAYRNGFQRNDLVANALVVSYSRCGSLASADYVFNNMDTKTVGSWNALISGYVQNGDPSIAINLYRQMQLDQIQSSEIAMVSVLSACAQLSALRPGREIHCVALKTKLIEDTSVSSSIIDMYAKCGSIEQSPLVFDRSREKDVVS